MNTTRTLCLFALAGAVRAQTPLPPVPVPAQNPITEAKRVLGKILFWEEQLSSDNTVACGTCHRAQSGGSDPRTTAIHPGTNGTIGNADDVRGSFGVIHANANDDYAPAPLFGLAPQVTRRRSPDFSGGLFASTQFWDGRATSAFTDPLTSTVLIPSGGSLESQALGPILSAVEMAHDARTWSDVTTKLVQATPLALATQIPSDMANAILVNATYPQLFSSAFGDSAVTPARIAFAIATYERTLVPNQTPFDAFVGGNPQALTTQQINGMNAFNGVGRCNQCHVPPAFTDGSFRNIGLRPVAEDNGRQGVSGLNSDRGKFKVPGLRNVALRPRFFHNGQQGSLANAVEEYDNSGGPFSDNRDPILAGLDFGPGTRNDMVAFLQALTDPRAANGVFPFDRPHLHSESASPGVSVFGPATPGSGGLQPQLIVNSPPNLGNLDFKVGVRNAYGGGPAFFAASLAALATPQPILGVSANIDPNALLAIWSVPTGGAGPGAGYATFHVPVPNDPAVLAMTLFGQWLIVDPAVGLAASAGIDFGFF